MTLANFEFAGHDPYTDSVMIHALHDEQLILGFVLRTALDDYFEKRGLTQDQRGLLVEANIEALGKIMDKKYSQETPVNYVRHGSTFPRVEISLDDLRLSGERLSASVLEREFVWG
jgi:hypothetical protein